MLKRNISILLFCLLISINTFGQVLYPDTVEVTGSEEIVFDYSSDACDTEDIPDGPAQAFRDIDGKIQIIAAHKVAYRMIGDDFNSLGRDCANGAVFSSDNSSTAGSFNNQEWLAGVYTPDGKTIYSIVHNEFKWLGDAYWSIAWYNTLTFATSVDTGRTYTHAAPPDHFLAGIPYTHVASGPMGIFGGSRPVYNPADGYYYVMVHLEAYQLQDWGVGVIRTQTLDDSDSWRGWDGSGFNVKFVDPYNETVTNPADHILEPVSRDNIGKMCESLTYNTYFGKFMVVGFHNKRNINTNVTVHGIYYSLSDDLINWSSPVLVYESPKTSWEVGGIYYPAIIDHNDTDRNFQRPGQDAYLYFTKWNSDSYNRDLVRVPIRFHKNIVSSFTVNSTGDLAGKNIGTGTGYTGGTNSVGDPEVTLRSAMHEVLASPDPDYVLTINFAIPGDGPHVIGIGSFLPEPDRPMIIDGYSQTGASVNTNALDEGNNAVLKIELDGSGSGGSVGFNLYSSDIIIKGLAIHSFGSGVQINNIGECTIQGCYIGTDASGAALGDDIGISIENASNNSIGGTDPASFNVITGEVKIDEGSESNEIRGNYIGLDATGANTVGSGCISIRNAANNIVDSNVSSGTYRGLEIRGTQAQNNTITNNFFGTDKTGVNGMGTGLIGVYVSEGASGNYIGKSSNGNVISSWQYRGVVIDSAFSNLVQGNWIGTDQGAATDIGNLNEAIHIINDAANNIIGGQNTGEGNYIAYNDGIAVLVGAETNGDLAGTGNAILGNQIFYNGYGIDIDPIGFNENDVLDSDTGPNNLQNSPTLSNVNITSGDTHFEGQLVSEASTNYRIEFFQNDGLDDSNLAQGQDYLGYTNVTTDANGVAAIDVHFTFEVQPGFYITATATDDGNNSSEFSAPIRAMSDLYFPDIDVSPTSLTFSVNPTQMIDDNVTIANTGTLSLDWSAFTSAAWIRLDKTSGTLNASSSTLLNVTVNPEGMQAGTHNDIIYIISTDPDEDTVQVSVSMTINGYAEVVVTPESLEIFVEPGNTGTDTLFVSNSGTTLLEYYLHTSNEYITVEPGWGRVLAGETDTVIVTANATSLGYGTYTELIRVDPVSDQQSITVGLTVNVVADGPVLVYDLIEISAMIELNGTTSYNLILTNPGTELLTWSASCPDPWVIPNPDTTSIPSGESDTITVTLDVTGVAVGSYSTNLWQHTNDPNNRIVGIPVSVNIIEPGPHISILPDSISAILEQGDIEEFEIIISNSGLDMLTCSILSQDQWAVPNVDTTAILSIGSDTICLLINTTDLELGENITNIFVRSNDQDYSQITIPITVYIIEQGVEFSVSQKYFNITTEKETNYQDTIWVTNNRSELIHFDIARSSDWVDISDTMGTIQAKSSMPFIIYVNVGNFSGQFSENIRITAQSYNWFEEITLDFDITVTPLPEVTIVPDSVKVTLIKGNNNSTTFLLKNNGSSNLSDISVWAEDKNNWMTINPSYTSYLGVNGTLEITVSIDGSGLDLGIYEAFCYVFFNDPNPAGMKIPVFISVVESGVQPIISVFPEALSYSLLAGSIYTDTLMIYNFGNAELSWSLGNQTTWLSFEPELGYVAAGDSMILRINIDTGPLSALNYADTLAFMSNDPDFPFLYVPVNLELIPGTGVDLAEFMPDDYMLFRNYPNPFNPATTIQYYVPDESMVEIKIFDFLGNEVKSLVKEKQSRQFYRIRWDGTNNRGIQVPSGMYFFRMSAKSQDMQYLKTRKMILLH